MLFAIYINIYIYVYVYIYIVIYIYIAHYDLSLKGRVVLQSVIPHIAGGSKSVLHVRNAASIHNYVSIFVNARESF